MKRILVVDDDLEQRDIYVELFRENGYKVISAYDGLDALQKIKLETPDVVFTGIMMPRMDGFELIRSLREDSSTASVPVIIFSHLNRDDDREKASHFPLTSFMAKGFNRPIEILTEVRRLLGDQYIKPPEPTIPDEQGPPANML